MPINNAVNTENGALYNETVKKKEIVSKECFTSSQPEQLY